MQAAMLLLGHTFPLRKCLKGHILVDMIEKTHTIVQTKLKRQEQKDQNDLKTENTEPVAQQSNHADSGSTCKCERCGRRLWQVSLASLALVLAGVAYTVVVSIFGSCLGHYS